MFHKLSIHEKLIKIIFDSIFHLVLTFGFMILFMFPINSRADGVNTTASANAQENTQRENEDCQAIWNSTWPLIKEGNVESRVKLLQYMYADHLEFPGRSGDYVSRIRDFTVVMVHSSEAMKSYQDVEPWKAYLTGLAGSDQYFECMKSGPSQKCAQVLVDQKAIPPFENFINEIDALIAFGKKPSCEFPPKDEYPVIDGYGKEQK